MGETPKVNTAHSIVAICTLLLLAVCFFVAVRGCRNDAVPVSYELAAGESVVIASGLESGTVAFVGLADLKKWEEYAAAGNVDRKMRTERTCAALGGSCRLRDGVRGVVQQVEGEWVRIAVGSRLWWVQDYALKRAD